jgi:hypothetical protein
MALSAAQLELFERDGALVIDTPLTPAELDAAEAAFDKLSALAKTPEFSDDKKKRWAVTPMSPVAYTAPVYDQTFIDFIGHPFFETVTQQVLRSQKVVLFECGPIERGHTPASTDPAEPEPTEQEQWESGMHLDVQLTRSGFEATPRREMLAIWVWLTDVPVERGAMRVLKGSHRSIMDHWEETLGPVRSASLPRVHGLRPHRPGAEWVEEQEYIPELESVPFHQQVPTPMVARRGQAQVFTQACLHAAARNTAADGVSRKAFIMSWLPVGVPGGAEPNRIAGLRAVYPEVRKRMRPGREHLIMDEKAMQEALFVSTYEDKWPETFLPRL